MTTTTDTTKHKQRLGPNYRKLFTASVISNLGDGVSQIGYPWLASAVTRNPILVAVVAFNVLGEGLRKKFEAA